MPLFVAPRARANSPSLCASFAAAAGLMNRGMLTSCPKMVLLVLTRLTSRISRGRNQIRSSMVLFASRVTQSVAAELKYAHAFLEKVRRATSSKSETFRIVSSGGFAEMESSGVCFGGGRLHSGVMVEMSRRPMRAEGRRFSESKSGVWMVL